MSPKQSFVYYDMGCFKNTASSVLEESGLFRDGKKSQDIEKIRKFVLDILGQISIKISSEIGHRRTYLKNRELKINS